MQRPLFLTLLTLLLLLPLLTLQSALLWPLPQSITTTPNPQSPQFALSDLSFRIDAVPTDMINQLLTFYIVNVFKSDNVKTTGVPITVNIVVRNASLIYADRNQHEKYEITIRNTNVWEIRADYYPGFVRAIETFSQLLQRQESGLYIIRDRPVLIDDQPNYHWRGIMIDTSRHYLPVQQIRKILDGLLYNKMNVLHWHIVDQDSFPMQVPFRPQLSQFGNLAGVYTPSQIAQIINYARVRSIRVIPEFDTPAHTRSWGRAPQLAEITYSGKLPYQGQFNPISNLTYDVMLDVMKYVNEAFPDGYMHLGGDEVEEQIWQQQDSIVSWLKQHNMTDMKQLQVYYRQRQREMLRKLNPNKTAIYWANQQIDLPVPQADTIQWWGLTANLAQLHNRTNPIILSNYDLTYLDVGFADELGDPYRSHISWRDVYNWTGKIAGVRVIGGEACMWAQTVNKDNIQQKLWIRSSALAERMWNEGVRIDEQLLQVVQRLIAQKERMRGRGFKVSPVTVGLCERDPSVCFG